MSLRGDKTRIAEAFVCDAIRTPIGRYGGVLSSVRTDDLAAVPLRALLERNHTLDPGAIEDVIFGCVNQAGEDCRNVARMALLLASIPHTVAGVTVNRLCASGLEAVATAARTINQGDAELCIAGGVESMSRAPFIMSKAESAFSRQAQICDSTIGWRFVNPLLQQKYGVDSMPETAEYIAREHCISREDQDRFAAASQQKALAAQSAGVFAQEIVPVVISRKQGEPLVVAKDEHPRETSIDALSRLKGIVRPDATVTAGNSSGVNDGAAAVIIASEAAARTHGLTLRARVLSTAVAGVLPRVMGLGPVPATRKLMDRLGQRLERVDVIELNEAFASQSLAVLRSLSIADDDPSVNPNGGAIALGHPLGMSGARLITTAVNQLHRAGGRLALCTMCIGVGQGIAMLLEKV